MHPILLQLGPLSLKSWGLFVAIGFALAIWYMTKTSFRYELTADDIFECGIWVMITGILSARVTFVIQFWEYYRSNLWDIFKIYEGGLVLHGGVLGVMIFLWFWSRTKKKPYLSILDMGSIPTIVGVAIGRIGCFLNGCCYGRETHLPIGVHIPGVEGIVHPTQLYEAVAVTLMAFLLLKFQIKERKSGRLFGLAIIMYSAWRFIIEYIRVNPIYLFFTAAQWMALVGLAVGLFCFLRSDRSPK